MSAIKRSKFPSVNAIAKPLVQSLIDDADSLGLSVLSLDNGSVVVDAGIEVVGGLEAGRRIAEICLAGLGTVTFRSSADLQPWSLHIDVHTRNPVIACLASQYAGWDLSHKQGEHKFNALGSGPARASGSKEPLFKELGYKDKADTAALVLEVDTLPPVEIADEVAGKCMISTDNLTMILTPTTSLSGNVQIIARVLETALHKLHELGFPLDNIIDGFGSAPICPPTQDFMTAMSRTNDAIMFAGRVHLFVDADDADTEELANKLPSSASEHYGRPFAEVFKEVNYDFYQIDPMLFSPASVTISSVKTGNSYHTGNIDLELLNKSFAGDFSE